MNEIWSNVNVVALNYSKFVLCCIEFVLIVVCKTYVTLFWMCTHRFSNPVTNLFASSYVRMVLSTRHILQNSLRYLLLQICVVFIFVLVSCFLQIQKRFFHLAASVWDRRNLRCNNLFIVKYFCCYEHCKKFNWSNTLFRHVCW